MATSVVPLVAEVGTELGRVKLEGGLLGGYRCEILTENLTEREAAMFKCPRCEGIMKEGSMSNKGEQLCVCCFREGEQPLCDSPVRNTILSLKCSCPLFKRGCEWLGRLENVENHLTTCGQVYVSCELRCGVVSTRDEMRRHVKEECLQRKEACFHCSEVYKVCEIVEHVEVCEKVEVMCELGCGTCVPRESILYHRESECSEETVVCPYEKYKCGVVGLKRRELKQHLEESRMLHFELKLEQTELKLEKTELKLEQTELKHNKIEEQTRLDINTMGETVKSLQNQIIVLESRMKIKDAEMGFLKETVGVREEKVKCSIENILNLFSSNEICSYMFLPFCTFVVAGYQFHLKHANDLLNFRIFCYISKGENHDSLRWPLKAMFITRVICHRNDKHSLIQKSPIIEYQKKEFYSDRRICSIPRSTNLKDFIRSDNLDLEFTICLLKSK